MLVSVVQIGNSRGIRLPKAILEQCEIVDKLEMEVHDKEIILKPVKNKPRAGWEDKFREMNEKGEDKNLFEDGVEYANFEWEW